MKRVNKKGFTLVELLAVIVILALLMAVAVTSMGGVLTNTRRNTTRQSAGSILDTVRLELQTSYITGNIPAGVYVFTQDVLDKGGTDAPLGGKFIYYDKAGGTAQAANNSTRIFKYPNSDKVTTISYKTGVEDFSTSGAFSSTTTTVSCKTTTESSASSKKAPSYVLIQQKLDHSTQTVRLDYAICLRVTDSGTTFWGKESDILSADGGGYFSDIVSTWATDQQANADVNIAVS